MVTEKALTRVNAANTCFYTPAGPGVKIWQQEYFLRAGEVFDLTTTQVGSLISL